MNKFIKQYLDNYIAICKTIIFGKAVIIETDTQIALISLNKNLLYRMKDRPLKKN